jgi:hypothetical protein
MTTLYQSLLFPNRAENLDLDSSYDVWLEHWKELSSAFRELFQNVYDGTGPSVQASGRILFVHGEQGTGKTIS